MSLVVFLDAGPLGVLCNARGSSLSVACNRWLRSLIDHGVGVVIPEVADYEVRRELVRLRRRKSIARLDKLSLQLIYLPITTRAMRLAAEYWADARQHGRPTAPDHALDGDVILAAQVIATGETETVVATSNPAHISRFVVADLWNNITPA